MTELAELRERLEAATGPDREIDELLWELHAPGVSPPSSRIHIPHWTASIDAALSLVDRLLPGWHVERIATPDLDAGTNNPDRLNCCILNPNLANDDGWQAGQQVGEHRASLAIAICLALIRALEAQAARERREVG